MKRSFLWGFVAIFLVQSYLILAEQHLKTFAEFDEITPTTEPVTVLRGTLSHGSYTPITITNPGVYRLAGAISNRGSDQDPITITANHVTLDLDGHKISGGKNGIVVRGNDVVIKNGTITGAAASGITLLDVSNCRIEHVDVLSTPTGFYITGDGAHALFDCRALQNSVTGYAFVSTGTNTMRRCQVADLVGTGTVYGVYGSNCRSNTIDSCIISNITAEAPKEAYGIYFDLVLSASNSITSNMISGVTNTLNAVGISVDSNKNYVAKNESCNNDVNYAQVQSKHITSQANARGIYNVDFALDQKDTVEVINSTIDTMVVSDLWSIESKAEVISSKIDTIPDQIQLDLWTVESKVEIISSKLDILNEHIDIPSKLDVIIEESWSIESKSEVISSKIDGLSDQLQPELWSIESKAEVISSKIDTIPDQLQPELWSIESKAEVISSKMDELRDVSTTELWSIESKAEVISSKIDTIEPALQPELWSIESKAEVISSKIDIPAPCALTPIVTGGTILTNKFSITGPATLVDSGDYCLSF